MLLTASKGGYLFKCSFQAWPEGRNVFQTRLYAYYAVLPRMQYYAQPLIPDTTRMPSRLRIQPYRRHFQLSDTADGWSVSVIEVLNCHFHQHGVCKEEWKCVCSELWALHHLPHLMDVFHREAEVWCLKHSFVSARLTSPITQPAAMK